jgi:hypothetical protein
MATQATEPVISVEPKVSRGAREFPFFAISAGPNFPKMTRRQWTVAIFALGILLSLFGWGFGLIVALVLLLRSAKDLGPESENKSAGALYLGVMLLMLDSILWFVIRR